MPMIPMPRARLLGRRHVGDVGLRDGDVGGGDAAEDARAEQQRQRRRQPEQRHADGRGGDAPEQHRPPPDPVGEAPPDRDEQELHHREDARRAASPRSRRRRGGGPRPGRNGITSPKPSRSRKTVRNSVPSEAARGCGTGRGRGWSWGRIASGRGRRGWRRRARGATRRRWRALGAAGELIAPVDDADGGGCGRAGGARNSGCTAARILAQALEQRRPRRAARVARKREAVEPELEVDARLVRRDEVGGAVESPGLCRRCWAVQAVVVRCVGRRRQRLKLGLDPLARDGREEVIAC